MDISYVEVLPNIWLTDFKATKNYKFLQSKKIELIVNCSKDLEFNNKYNCKCIRLSVSDNLQEEEIDRLYKYFFEIVPIIYEFFCKGKPILVHCYAGKQRSASVIVAFILKYTNLTLRDSISYLKLKKKNIFTPCNNFIKALEKYENKVC